MLLTKYTQRDRGIGIIEILVGSAIISLVLFSIVVAFHLYIQAGLKNTEKIQAAYLLEEGIEAVRFIRDNSWSIYIDPLSTTTQYRLYFNGAFWEITATGQPLIDGVFDRILTIEDVYRRDLDSDIVASTSPDANTFDPNTKYITVNVSWAEGISTSTMEMQTYFTNIFEI